MITPSYGLTATERVLPSFTLDWTTGLVQSTVDATRAGVATFVGSNGLIQSASADTQRIDYSTGIAGLLVEESRINLATKSEEFNDAVWTKAGASITTNAIESPDGELTAEKLVENTANSEHYMRRAYSGLTANTNYTTSIFLKAGGRTNFSLRILDQDNTANGYSCAIDLANQTATVSSRGSGVGLSAQIKAFEDGWFRISVVGNAGAACTRYLSDLFMQNPAGTGVYTGDGTSGVFLWGAQLEAGAFPTSYIPTEASAVTRNADVATVTGTNFSDFYNEAQGAFAVECVNFNNVAADTTVICVDDGATNQQNQNAIRVTTQGTSYFNTIRTAGSEVSSLNPGAADVGSLAKLVGAYKLNSFAAALNGSSITTDNVGAVPPSQTRLRIGTRGTGAVRATMLLRKILYWPQRLTNAEVQAFSK